jgi:hypothetical protein
MVVFGPYRSHRGPIKTRPTTVLPTAVKLEICTWDLVKERLALITGIKGAMANQALKA